MTLAAPCAACEEARRRAKAAGHRNHRKAVCFDHAAVDLDAWLKGKGLNG